jgi:hypothetical protein
MLTRSEHRNRFMLNVHLLLSSQVRQALADVGFKILIGVEQQDRVLDWFEAAPSG